MTLSARMCRKVKLLLETRWTLNRVVLLFLLHCKDALDQQASSLGGILQPTALPKMNIHLGLIRGRRSVLLKCWASDGHVWTVPKTGSSNNGTLRFTRGRDGICPTRPHYTSSCKCLHVEAYTVRNMQMYLHVLV
jgi:hypothetical protein